MLKGQKIGKNARADIRSGEAVKFVNDGGTIYIDGGTVIGTTQSAGKIIIGNNTGYGTGTIVKDTTLTGGSMTVDNDETVQVSNTNVTNASLILNKGTITDTTLNSGSITVGGATVEGVTAYEGYVTINEGSLNEINLNGDRSEGGISLRVNGGTSKDITGTGNTYFEVNDGQVNNVNFSGGSNTISVKGGTVENVSLSGINTEKRTIFSVGAGTVDGIIINDYAIVNANGGVIDNTTINANGWMGVRENSTVTNTTIERGGRQTIYENAKSSRIEVKNDGELVVNESANAENVTADGTIYLRNDTELTGETVLTENGFIDLGGIVNSLYDDEKLSGREENGSYSIENLEANKGSVGIFNAGQNLSIGKLTGEELNIITEVIKDNAVTIDDKQNSKLNIIATAEATNTFDANDIAGSMQDLADTIGITQGSEEKYLSATGDVLDYTGKTNAEGIIDENSIDSKTSMITEGIGELANVAFMAWRAENDEMHQRMGELRSSTGEAGIWARMKRGESESGDLNINNQYNTYQLGYDEKVGDSNWYIGGAISRTEGKSSFANGSGENQSTGFTVYGTYIGDDGQYLDLSAKYARLDNEFDVIGRGGLQSKGDYRNNGYAISAEYGKRIAAANNFWIEPQVQLTYGHLSSANYTTSRGVEAAQDAMDSVVGRVGFAAGKEIGAGDVYVKASYLYDFDGDTSVTMSKNGQSDTYEQDLGGGWFEFGIGTNINISETSHLYFDVEKAVGGDIDTPWQWNAGVRFDF